MERLKNLRTQRKLSQRAVAEIIGTTQKSVDNWEKSVVSPAADTVLKLADYFGCSTDYLLGREDEFGNINVNSNLTAEQQKILFYFDRCDKYKKITLVNFAKYLSEVEKI